MTDVMAFVEEMNAASVDWQLIVYGGALHGFTHQDASAYEIPGVGYDAQADARSWKAMESFLAEVFGADPTNDRWQF
jgi:dienelactone hydrolase